MNSPLSTSRRKSAVVDPLAQLKPEGLTGDDASWQARKRADFRVTVLEAAMTCLAENGYAKTTTELVAATARVSRGTMLHRFPTRRALIEATIDYAFFRRMQNVLADVKTLSEDERVNQNLGILIIWKQYATREYRAYLELHIAAKTDPELREVFVPRAKLYDEVWRREVGGAFPEWVARGSQTLDRVSVFVRAALEGLALNNDVWDDPELLDGLIKLLGSVAQMIRDNRLPLELPSTRGKSDRKVSRRSRPKPR